ncbi:MAG: DUF177 domain-containing protein [Deltaproteobacteria bacterium]|nr:DUF177 domain-containing protein [Deltaproteobacteria bacterium]MBI4224558.1 DUF177 domain-containing protein [Deltaproteobacteria bacterium]
MKNNHKMEIIVKDIPEEGLELDFDAGRTPWFLQVLRDALGKQHAKEDRAQGHLSLLRIGENIDCEGRVECDCHPTCCRCLKVFHHHLDVPVHQILAPLYESERQLKLEQKEEVELVKEDLEFAYYENDRFDLGDMVREQIILSLPLQPLCQEACKGLCPVCGKNLNEGPCQCKARDVQTRRIPLKAFKRG